MMVVLFIYLLIWFLVQNFLRDLMALIAEFMCLKILEAGLRMFMYEFFIPNPLHHYTHCSWVFFLFILIKHAGF